MKITIKNKLLLCFTALIILSVVVQLIFNLFFADKLYAMYKEQYMERSFYEIEENYSGDVDDIMDVIGDMEDTHNIHLMISSGNEVIYATYMDMMEEAGHNGLEDNSGVTRLSTEDHYENGVNDPEEYANVPQEREMMVGTNTEEILNLSGSFEYQEETINVTMTLPIASLENSVNFFTNSYAIISLFILVMGVIISSRVARSITKPIEKVEKISYKLSNLEFDEYISEDNATREVDSLARSVNRMSQELKSKIEDLNDANNKLQQDVEYRMRLEQMRKEFVANVSHEMKTPLAVLQFYCENLRSDIEGIDKEYYYETIIEEIRRMDEMVKSMLEISSLENGVSKMEMEEMSLSELVEYTTTKLQPLLTKVQVMIMIEPDIMIQGNFQYLEHAIKNYLTNASSHTSDGECVEVSLVRVGTFARFSVYNDGVLIEPDQLERIWESFYKSDKARVREANTNVGLGLYIVKCIIENHKGSYGVENKENGVEFFFEIPIVE